MGEKQGAAIAALSLKRQAEAAEQEQTPNGGNDNHIDQCMAMRMTPARSILIFGNASSASWKCLGRR